MQEARTNGGCFSEGDRIASNRAATLPSGKDFALFRDCGSGRRLSRHYSGSGGNLSASARKTKRGDGRFYPNALSAGRSAVEFFCATRQAIGNFHRNTRMERAVAQSLRRPVFSATALGGNRRNRHGFQSRRTKRRP